MPGLEPFLGGALANAAAVCLDTNGHQPGVNLGVSGEYEKSVQVVWTPPSRQVSRSYADLQEATEYGAAGVAIAALNHFGGFVVMQRSRKGSGFDYWISKGGNPSGPLFQNCTPLEVSGILSGNDEEVERRVRTKKQQISVSRRRPRRVAVVEFGMPKARIIRS